MADSPPGVEAGKRFFVTDDKIRLIFGATATPYDSLGGSTIEFLDVHEAPSIVGTSVTDLTFVAPDGRRFVYRINRPLASVMNRKTCMCHLPSGEHGKLGRLSAPGQKTLCHDPHWRDDADNSVSGRQFVEIRVDSVTSGNDIYPIKVSFTDLLGNSARIFLHPGPRGHTPRSFPVFFSFTDPRLKYPAISDAVRENIINGRVALEMTREECRLALGAPREVDRGADNSYLREVRLYENGIYLVFEDGLLKRFRR